jgi:hypothetical protein
VAVNVIAHEEEPPEDVEIVDNRAYNLRLGLLGYKSTGQGTYTWPETCLKRSLVSGNHVSVIDVQGWAVDVAAKLYFAIDMGIDATKCLYNIVADNVIEGCFCGIRAGMFSRVRSNLVLGCRHTGIVATSNGTVPTNPGAAENDAAGFTEIYGNHVELGYYDGAPWWRAGIRLEVTSCQVSGNTIVVGNLAGCGIVHGPLDLSDRDSIESHVAALRDGGHAVTGNSIIMNPVADDGTIDRSQYVTRPGTMGIVMLSTGNRVGNNAVLHARTGVLVTADCTVCDNVITPAVVAIVAWSKNTVGGNAIGWFPHTSQALPWTMEGEPETGAILLSNENTCHGNSIVSGAHDPSARLRPAAVNVKDWPVQIFGSGWITKFDVTYWQTPTIPLAEVLVGKRVGGNVITGCAIDLSNPSGVAGEKSSYFSLDGIILEGEDASEERGNTVVGTTIRRGERAVVATSGPVTLSSCTCHLPLTYGLHLVASPRSAVSGSLFHTSSGQAVRVEEDSTDLALNDCLLVRDTESAAKADDLACLVQLADRVSVNDCAIVSYGSPGIYWAGDLGLCGGCWFFCHKGLSIDWSNIQYSATDFFPAIRFASTNGGSPAPDTQGNHVFGAHMLHCLPLESGAQSYSPIEWSNAYLMYNPTVGTEEDNPFPPTYSNGRWSNRVNVHSCYYRYDSN